MVVNITQLAGRSVDRSQLGNKKKKKKKKLLISITRCGWGEFTRSSARARAAYLLLARKRARRLEHWNGA